MDIPTDARFSQVTARRLTVNQGLADSTKFHSTINNMPDVSPGMPLTMSRFGMRIATAGAYVNAVSGQAAQFITSGLFEVKPAPLTTADITHVGRYVKATSNGSALTYFLWEAYAVVVNVNSGTDNMWLCMFVPGQVGAIGSWEQLGNDIDGEADGDWSGNSVSLSADGYTVAIGALKNDDSGQDAGHTRVYSWNDGGWVQLGNDIDGEASGDFSGYSVSLSADGRTVAIGAKHNNGSGVNSGHTRVYEFYNNQWVQLGNDINGEASGDESGYSVCLSADGNTVAIGSIFNDNTDDADAGHVRVYDYHDNQWYKLGQDIEGAGFVDYSGHSVSLSADGNTVAIGAKGNDGSSGDDSGHVRVYSWNDVWGGNPPTGVPDIASSWVQLGNEIDGEDAGDQSGWSVSLSADGNTVAIGAPYNDGTLTSGLMGHTRVYSFNGSSWEKLGQDIDGEASADQSALSVSLSADGRTVAIGGQYNDGSGTNAGSTRVYSFNGSEWSQLAKDIDGEAANDWSGNSVSLSADGKIVAIAGHNNDGSGQARGHVRVYYL